MLRLPRVSIVNFQEGRIIILNLARRKYIYRWKENCQRLFVLFQLIEREQNVRRIFISHSLSANKYSLLCPLFNLFNVKTVKSSISIWNRTDSDRTDTISRLAPCLFLRLCHGYTLSGLKVRKACVRSMHTTLHIRSIDNAKACQYITKPTFNQTHC